MSYLGLRLSAAPEREWARDGTRLRMAESSHGQQAMTIAAADIALLELESNVVLIRRVMISCAKHVPGRGLSQFQGLLLCRRIFHNSATGLPVSTTACTRGMPDKSPRTGVPNPHGSVNSFRNVVTNTISRLRTGDPGVVDAVSKEFRSAVWFGPWNEAEVRSTATGRTAAIKNERCFLMKPSDEMWARGVPVLATPGDTSCDAPTDKQAQQIALFHPVSEAVDGEEEMEVDKDGDDDAAAQTTQSRKRKMSEERYAVPAPSRVLEAELLSAGGSKPAPIEPAPSGPAPSEASTVMIAALTGEEWYGWNRKHTTGSGETAAESHAKERLDALKLCAELTKRLLAKGLVFTEPYVMDRATVLSLNDRDLHPRADAPKDPLGMGLVPSVINGAELQLLRGLAFRRNGLAIMNAASLKAAEEEIQKAEAASLLAMATSAAGAKEVE